MDDLQMDLVEGIKRRDSSAYHWMIEKYSKPAYLLAYHILQPYLPKEDIEECVADVFAEAWYKIHQFNEARGNFRTWILILTKYTALNYKRKRLKEQAVVDIDTVEMADRADIERQVVMRQDQLKILEILNTFKPMDKEIFIRRYFFDEDIEVLADAFQLSRTAIVNRLYRGRKKIKEVFQG